MSKSDFLSAAVEPLGIVYEKEPNKIIVASNGSPLLIGIGKNANYISSDINALSSKTKKYISLEDNEFGIVSKDTIELFNVKGKRIKRTPSVTKQSINTITKNGYKHFMQKEIFEQKDIITRVIKDKLGASKILPNIFGPQSDSMLKSIKHVHFVACGTSYNASLVAKYCINDVLNGVSGRHPSPSISRNASLIIDKSGLDELFICDISSNTGLITGFCSK